MKPFPTFPNDRMHVIQDDVDAQALMARLGIYDALKKQRDPEKNQTILLADTHPTHWCICVEYRGYEDPKDNGYAVFTHPKKHVDPVQAHMLVMQMLQGSEDISAGMFMANPLD